MQTKRVWKPYSRLHVSDIETMRFTDADSIPKMYGLEFFVKFKLT